MGNAATDYDYTHDKCKEEHLDAHADDKRLDPKDNGKTHADMPAQGVKDVTKLTPLRPVAGTA